MVDNLYYELMADLEEGWAIDASDQLHTIDFDQSVANVNRDSFAGRGFSPAPGSGQLDSRSWALEGVGPDDVPLRSFAVAGEYGQGESAGGTGSGGVYSFEVQPGDRALGFQATGSHFAPGTITLSVRNATGVVVDSALLGFDTWVFNDQGRSNSFDLSYSTQGDNFQNVPSLDYSSIEGADAAPQWSLNPRVGLLNNLDWQPDSILYLRWTTADNGGSGSRDEFAIDNIKFVANPDQLAITLDSSHYESLGINEDWDFLNDFSLERFCAIGPRATLTVDHEKTLTIGEDIRNEGRLRLKSGATLLQEDGDAANSGQGTYQIDRAIHAEDYRRYNYWGSPVPGISMQQAFPKSNPADFFQYDPSDQSWQPFSDSVMTAGRGYITTPDTNTTGSGLVDVIDTVAIAGNDVHNGAYTYQTGGVDDPDTTDDFFVLAANPYPSAIDAQTLLDSNTTLEPTIWFWDHQGDIADADYATWNQTGGVTATENGKLPDGTISSGQGFMLMAKNSGSLGVEFSNAMRLPGQNTQFFKSSGIEPYRSWLALKRDSGSYNQMLLALHGQFTTGIDPGWDATKFKGGSELAFYALTGNEELAIRALPPATGSQTQVVPLGVDAWETGSYSIYIDSLDNWPAQQALILVDSGQGGSSHDLRTGPYTFQVQSPDSWKDRFYLFTGGATMADSRAARSSAFTEVYPRGEGLTIEVEPGKRALKKARLLSLGGQPLATWRLDPVSNQNISIGSFKNLYLLEITDRSGKRSYHKVWLGQND